MVLVVVVLVELLVEVAVLVGEALPQAARALAPSAPSAPRATNVRRLNLEASTADTVVLLHPRDAQEAAGKPGSGAAARVLTRAAAAPSRASARQLTAGARTICVNTTPPGVISTCAVEIAAPLTSSELSHGGGAV